MANTDNSIHHLYSKLKYMHMQSKLLTCPLFACMHIQSMKIIIALKKSVYRQVNKKFFKLKNGDIGMAKFTDKTFKSL